MQFSPSRYPSDVTFQIAGTMGVVAREFEQSQLVGLLSNISPDQPSHALILRAIIELSSSPKRDEILKQLDEMNKPDPEQQKMEQEQKQIQMELQREALKEQQYENAKTLEEIKLIQAETAHQIKMTDLEDEKVDIQAANTALGKLKIDVQKDSLKIQREKNHMDDKQKSKAANKKPAK
jgi:hypothetical protein